MQSFKIIKPIHILTPYVRYYWILEDGADVSVSVFITIEQPKLIRNIRV